MVESKSSVVVVNHNMREAPLADDRRGMQWGLLSAS